MALIQGSNYPKPFLSGTLIATVGTDEIVFPIPCDREFTIGRAPALAAKPSDGGYIDNRFSFISELSTIVYMPLPATFVCL